MSANQPSQTHSDASANVTDSIKAAAPSKSAFSAIDLMKEGRPAQMASGGVRVATGSDLIMADPFKPANTSRTPKFTSPQIFLDVLNRDFSDISGGKNTVTMADLTNAAKDSKNPLERAAAATAAAHFNSLSGISAQNDGTATGLNNKGRVLSKSDVNLAWDMEMGKTAEHAIQSQDKDVENVLQQFGSGFIHSVESMGHGALDMVARLDSQVVKTFGNTFDSFNENQKWNSLASKDQKEFTSWMKK
jgi:hypothetical protein